MLIIIIIQYLYFYTDNYCKYFICYFVKLEICQCGRVTLTKLSGANNLEAQVQRIINESVIDESFKLLGFFIVPIQCTRSSQYVLGLRCLSAFTCLF